MTVKQAKVYLALVFLGTALVGDISKYSKVRREEVYRILPKLEKMGLIEKTLSTPVRLKATSVENALSLLIKIEEENSTKRIEELTLKKQVFLGNIRASSQEPKIGNGDQFSLTSEKAVALSKFESLIGGAKKELDYCASREKLVQFVKYFSEQLNQAVERGVQIRFISTSPKGADELPQVISQVFVSKKSITLRYSENIPNHFLVVDNSEVLISTSTAGYLADNPLLWSSNGPHVMVHKRLFEELWNSSVETVALTVDNDIEKLKRFIKNIKPAGHFILLYETGEAKFRVLLNYLKYGLDNGEAAIYVCSDSSVEEVTDAMLKFNIDVNLYQKSGALKILDYTQHYIIDGLFDLNNTLALWKRYYDEAISKGFKGLRVTGETACFFKHNLLKELITSEKSLHQTMDIPMIAISAYRAEQLMRSTNSANVYAELAKAHGNVLFTSIDKELGRIAIS
jgi:sugar-specific transcriptional regulator TrmB